MEYKPLKILYVDDDPDDLQLMIEVVPLVGNHILHCVNDSRNFISEVKQFRPDLIFLDYNMPLCDGRDCLEALKQEPELASVPVIMYCTSSSTTTLIDCYDLGAIRYLLKPVDYAGIVKGLDLIFHLHFEGRLIKSDFEHFFIDTYKLN